MPSFCHLAPACPDSRLGRHPSTQTGSAGGWALPPTIPGPGGCPSLPATVIRSCLRRLWGLVWTLWPERWGGALAHPALGPQESLGKPLQWPWNRLMQRTIAQGGRGGGGRGGLPQRPAESHLTPCPPPTKLPSPGQQMWVILLATGDLWTSGRQRDCITTLPSSLSWTLPKAGLPVVRAPPSPTLSC